MKRGLTNITNPRRGTTAINKVMRGAELVWERTSQVVHRFYAASNEVGGQIHSMNTDTGTWSSILNPSAAMAADALTVSQDGTLVLITGDGANPILSSDSGLNYNSITLNNILAGRVCCMMPSGVKMYVCDNANLTDIISFSSGGSWATVSTPPEVRYNQMSWQGDGVNLYGVRNTNPELAYYDGTWQERQMVDGLYGVACGYDNYLYLGYGDGTVAKIDNPPLGPKSSTRQVGSVAGTMQVQCSADGRYVLAIDYAVLGVYLSTDFGDTWVSITNKFTFNNPGFIQFRSTRHISQDGACMIISDQDAVHISEDYGSTWQKIPFATSGVMYMAVGVTQ